MLETYFPAAKMLGHLRSGPSGPYLDGFAAALERQGYSPATAVRYLRAAAHVGHVMAEHGWQAWATSIWRRSASTCAPVDVRAPREAVATTTPSTAPGSFAGTSSRSACAGPPPWQRRLPSRSWSPDFKAWLRKHRGASDPTIKLYARDAARMMTALGADPTGWGPAVVRSYFMERASKCGSGTVEKLTTSLRAFLRYLAVEGRCQAGLDNVVPAYAHWRLADMPRYLSAEQVNRLIAACDGEAIARRRDRAIVLLLARLGLRAGDVAQLRLADIEWQTGSLRVSGKSRYEVRLPLPQDVGDAIAAYLECRPSAGQSDHVFLRTIAPCRPFRNGDGISSVVKRLMKRAGIVTPVKGAHVLRHTAATEMLRHGVPLEKIGLVLRHRGIDTTAYYAKADVALLKQVAQPWPEAL